MFRTTFYYAFHFIWVWFLPMIKLKTLCLNWTAFESTSVLQICRKNRFFFLNEWHCFVGWLLKEISFIEENYVGKLRWNFSSIRDFWLRERERGLFVWHFFHVLHCQTDTRTDKGEEPKAEAMTVPIHDDVFKIEHHYTNCPFSAWHKTEPRYTIFQFNWPPSNAIDAPLIEWAKPFHCSRYGHTQFLRARGEVESSAAHARYEVINRTSLQWPPTQCWVAAVPRRWTNCAGRSTPPVFK